MNKEILYTCNVCGGTRQVEVYRYMDTHWWCMCETKDTCMDLEFKKQCKKVFIECKNCNGEGKVDWLKNIFSWKIL